MKTYVRFIPIITTTDHAHMFSCHVLRPDTIWALLKALSWRTQKRKKLQLQWLYRDIKLIVLWNYHLPTDRSEKEEKKALLMTPNLILTKLTENSLSSSLDERLALSLSCDEKNSLRLGQSR